MRLLIIEDSHRLRDTLREGLSRSGFSTDCAADGIEGLSLAMSTDYDTIVLDLMLPGMPGLEVLRRLRDARRRAQVLILSARDAVADRIEGLQSGADDYLVKPFDFDELLARLRALSRRAHGQPDPVLRVGPMAINTALREVTVSDRLVPLTPIELSLLEILALSRGRVQSPNALEQRLYDHRTIVNRNTIEAHVSKLRRKLRAAGAGEPIETRRGFGYLIP
ncbi:MAG: response regulator transcription factor [Burkholderiaceae bacterium]